MKRQYVSIGEVTKWISGGTPNRSVAKYWMGSIPWISASTLKPNEIHKSDQHLTPEAVAVGSMMAPIGATLLLVRGSALYKEIRAGTVVSPVCFNQDVKALIPDSRIIPKFLTYSILGRTADLLKLVSTAGNSAGVLDTKLVQSLDILLPSESEQRAIAEALSDVDSLLESLDALIAKKRAIKQAAMQQLLTGETRLPGFTKEWEPKLFGEVVSIRNEKILPCHVDLGTICVELEHIASGEGQLLRTITSQDAVSSKYKFSSGDVLFGRLRPYLRKYWLTDCYGICTTEIWPLVPCPGKMVSGFLFGLIQSEAFIETANVSYGTHMPRADWGVMSGFDFLLPSPEEQTAITAVLSDMDVEITALQQRRDKTHAIKQAMMQQLLTGRVRLV